MAGPIKLADLKVGHIKGVIYGSAGVGKTTFACSSQKLRTLVFDVDAGAYSAAAWAGTRKELVDVFRVPTISAFGDAFDYLKAHVSDYDLVVVDTATELQRQAIGEVAKSRRLQTLDQQGWGIVLEMMELFMRDFRHLPLHVLWLAHEVEKEDPDTKRLCYRPSFQGAFATAYSKHFTFIARYQVFDEQKAGEDGKVATVTHRWLNCERDAVTQAKNRGGALSKWEAPNVDGLFDKMVALLNCCNEGDSNE